MKTLRKKEKLLVTSNFSFSHGVFKSTADSKSKNLFGKTLSHFIFISYFIFYFMKLLTVFSSPEHEVLMVSYCDRAVSVVRRPSCVVRRPSPTFYLVYALEATVLV